MACQSIPLAGRRHEYCADFLLLGHEHLQTTMVYLDITTEQELKALATLDDENDKTVSKKRKNSKGGLAEFCILKAKKRNEYNPNLFL